jgi:hypothetical protein
MSFVLSALLGATTQLNENTAAKKAAEVQKKKDEQALALKNAELAAQEKRELAKIERTAAIEEDKTLSTFGFYQEEARKWNKMYDQNPLAKRAVATPNGLEFVEPFVKAEKKDEPDPITRLSPFAHIVADSKDMDVVYFPKDGDMDAYHKRLRTAKKSPVLGEDVFGFMYRAKGGESDTRKDYGLRAMTDFLFRDGYLEKFQKQAENNNPKNLNRAIKQLQMFWRDYSTSEQAKMKIDENAYVIQTIIDYDPIYGGELAGANDKFFNEVVASTISDVIDMDANELRRQLGLPTNGPTDFNDKTGELTVSTEDYTSLGWAVDQKTGGYSAEFKSHVSKISQDGDLNEIKVFETLNSMGAEDSREFMDAYAKSQKWYSDNTPYVVQDGMLQLDMGNIIPPNADQINQLLSNFDNDPKTKLKLVKAMFGSSLVNKLPGKFKGGKVTAKQLISKNITDDDIQDHVNRSRASTNIINQVDLLTDLITKHGVKGGLSADVLTTVPGMLNQFEAILDSVNLRPFSDDYRPLNPQLDMDARQEFNALKSDVKQGIRSGNVDAEKLYKAVSRALMYSVASMLQGGDFRNISDYDVRLAGERMGNIMGMMVDLESSLPTLAQLREEAAFMKTVSDGFATGDMGDIAAAAYLFNQRGAFKMEAESFLDRQYGAGAGGASSSRSSTVVQKEIPKEMKRTAPDSGVPTVR